MGQDRGVNEVTHADALVADARAIATRWREEMDLGELTSALLSESGLRETSVDVVAIGKASREMSAAVVDTLGAGVQRRITVCDEASLRRSPVTPDVVVGEHPVPGEGSLRAGEAVLNFLDQPSAAEATLFLISGGASSLCVAPVPPLSLDDLHAVWEAVLRSGADITTLNMIRAASSQIAGGAVLRHVGTSRSTSFILVDNVISGARWVASALTYDFQPSEDEMVALWDTIDLTDVGLRARLLAGLRSRDTLMSAPRRARHENLVLGEPAMMLGFAVLEAQRRGYEVIDMGASISGDVPRCRRRMVSHHQCRSSRSRRTRRRGRGHGQGRWRGRRRTMPRVRLAHGSTCSRARGEGAPSSLRRQTGATI